MKTITKLMIALVAMAVVVQVGPCAKAATVRLDGLGQGSAPGVMFSFFDLGAFKPSVGMLQHPTASPDESKTYSPSWDLTLARALDKAEKASFYGRVGSDFDAWPMAVGAGLCYAFDEWAGMEFEFGWTFDKVNGELQYTQANKAEISLNLWADF